MGKVEELKEKLANLQKKRNEDAEIRKLQKQIRMEEFSQTKGGKIFNKIGDFGLLMGKGLKNVGKVITTPPAQKKGHQVKRKSLNEVIAGLPQ